MGYRTFQDTDGHSWEVVDRSYSQWEFRPIGGNPNAARRARAPGYETDPYELSSQELQRILTSAPTAGAPPKRSPFKD